MRPIALISLICLPLLCGGCSLRRAGAHYAGSMIDNGMSAYYEEQDLDLVKESLPPNLKLMEVLLRNNPQDLTLRTTLSQGYCSYAFMFQEDSDPERAKYFYRKGAGFTAGLEQESLKRNPRLMPALFWNSFCRAGYIQLDLQNPDSIAELPSLEKTADLLLETDPDYYYGGPHALKGALAAARPVMMGGNPTLAKQQFEAALQGTGAEFKLNLFLYAKTYAVQTQDRELFGTLLRKALEDSRELPEQRLANEAVRLRAKHLLERENDLF